MLRYENVLLTRGYYDKIVRDLWQRADRGTGLGGFANSLSVHTSLDSWGSAAFGNFKRKLSNL